MYFAEDITVERSSSPGAYDDDTGRFVPPAFGTMLVAASVQPLPYREAKLMPEGTRLDEWIAIYSDEELLADDDKNQQKADIVQWKGGRYKVDRVTDYSTVPLVLAHFMSRAQLVPPTEA